MTKNAALLARAIDAQGLGRVVADIALVDIGPLDLDTGERLGFGDDGPQGVAVIRPAVNGLGMEHELAAGRAGVGGGDRDFAAELLIPPAAIIDLCGPNLSFRWT